MLKTRQTPYHMSISCRTCLNRHLILLGLTKMNKLENVIFGFDIPDIRAAFYYLSRYLKQADSIDEYEKDFFEDDFRSAPSEIAKKLTFSLIEFIEMQAGKKASEFNDQE